MASITAIPSDNCAAVTFAITYCSSKLGGYSGLQGLSLASCVCSTQLGSQSWGSASFDNAVSGCHSELSGNQIATGFDTGLSSLDRFCATYFTAHTQTATIMSQSVTVTVTTSSLLRTAQGSSISAGTASSQSRMAIETPTANPNSSPPAAAAAAGGRLAVVATLLILLCTL